MEFALPLKFEHLAEDRNDNKFFVQNVFKVDNWDENRQKKQLEKAMNILFSTDESAFEIKKFFDVFYAFVYHFQKLSSEIQDEVLKIVTAAFNAVVSYSEKNPVQDEDTLECYKMYLVLLYGIFTKAKGISGSKAFKVLSRSLPQFKNLYSPEKPDTRFLEMIIEIGFSEIERGSESEVVEVMKWVKDIENPDIWEGWRAKAINVLFGESEKCVKPLVSIVKNDPSLLNDFLASLSEGILANNQVNETQGIKNVGIFITKLTAKMPREMLMNVSVIVHLLNCEVFSLRNSVVLSIGEILCYIIKKDMDQSAERDTYTNYREQLLQILKSRIMDKSSFCRAKVLEAFETLTKESLLPRDWFLPVLKIASSRLLDSTALVRKKATGLLENLVYQNKLLEGEMKIEPRESIEAQLQKHKDALRSYENALEGQYDETTAGLDKEEAQQKSIKEQILVKFLEGYLEMIQIFQNSIKILIELLKSKNTSDVIGSIDVLVACSLRDICEPNEVVSAMLSLVSNSEQGVRKKVLDAFYNIYLNKKFNPEDSSINKILQMIETLNIGQLASLESLFTELFAASMVPGDIKKKIWLKFKNEESYPSACILRFLALSTDRSFLERRYDTFASRTLALSNNWKIFRECLLAFQFLEYQGEKTDNLLCKAAHQLFEIETSGWYPVAEQLIRTCSVLCESPLSVFKALAIKGLKILLEGNSREADLAKAIFIGGEIAMKVVVYGDKLGSEFKKRMETAKTNDELEEINGGRAAQVQLELKALKISQENIVFEGLLSKFTPIILSLVKKLDEVKTLTLRKVLVLSLAKLMCINQKICEQNLLLLIKIAKENEDSGIRSTAVISLGDLVMRHPNMLEQQSGQLFSLLTDTVVEVRKKALLIISHLVLNDMLKMKGLMANILKCYLDLELRGIVCVFIEELNQKSPNDIYNMIPDSISNMLKMDLSHNEFKTIVDMIFAYITKERQGENLTEKLSSRFKDGGKDDCLNIGYCLSKLPINEKAMRKLLDGVSWWQNKVIDDQQLLGYFADIATKCKRNWKTDSKVLIEEFEAAMRGEEEVVRKRKGRNNQ